MDQADIIIADDNNFEFQVVMYSEQIPVLVFFWAEWCLVCRQSKPVLEDVAEEHLGRFRLALVDVDTNPQLSKRYSIQNVPTLKVFENGVISNQIEGIKTSQQVSEFLTRIIPGKGSLLIQKAYSLIQSKDYQSVEEICLEILEEIPEHSLAKLLLAKSLIWQEEYLEAFTILSHFPASKEYPRAELLKPLVEQLISHQDQPPSPSNSLDLIYQRALELIKLGNFPAAMDGLLNIIQEDKDYRDGSPRLVILGIFELLGEGHEITREYRPLLASSLF